jgi:enediyne core biosynthesis thioesterase
LKHYEYRHIVGLEETNMTGNVYFVNHLRWQGRCREMFLRDHAPGVLRQLSEGLVLLTVRCSCDYLSELAALDEISVRLFLDDLFLNRLVLRFEYWRISGASELVARGVQEIACMRRVSNGAIESADIPDELRRALEPYRVEAQSTAAPKWNFQTAGR